MRERGLPLNHAMNPQFSTTLVQRLKPGTYGRIRFGSPLIMAYIFNPGRCMVAFSPDFRVFEITHQSPMSRAIANTDAPARSHKLNEFSDIVLTDRIVDHDDDGSATRFQIECEQWFAELIERVQIKGFEFGQSIGNSHSAPNQHDSAGRK